MNFIKINNEDIKNNELNNNLPLFCFLMFNINDRNELCTSINQIAYEFKYKLNSKNTNGIQSSIKSELIKMSEKNIISLIPTYNCSSFDDITNNKLFKIKILNYDKNVSIKNNFTVLTYSEYKKILDCKDCGSKVYNMINLFLLIKSYEFTNESLCLDSINNMCHKLNRNTAFQHRIPLRRYLPFYKRSPCEERFGLPKCGELPCLCSRAS